MFLFDKKLLSCARSNTANMSTYVIFLLTVVLIASSESGKIKKRSIVNRFTNNPLFLSHFSGTGYGSQYSSDPWAWEYNTRGK